MLSTDILESVGAHTAENPVRALQRFPKWRDDVSQMNNHPQQYAENS
jgi:hypothetical protein